LAQGEQINSAILVWARETAGLDVRDAAHNSDSRRVTPTVRPNSSNWSGELACRVAPCYPKSLGPIAVRY